MWTGEKVRLRGVEPEDWEGFRDLAQDTVDTRNADLVTPPRSAESFRSWTAERAGRPPGARHSAWWSRGWPTGRSQGR